MIQKNISNDIGKSGGTYCFYIDKINEKFPGLSKLIEKIKVVFGEVIVINSLEGVENENSITTVGVVASHFYLQKFKKGNTAFVIDATTLGFLSVAKFYIKRKDFFNKELIGSVLRYVKYYFIEKNIIKKFKQVVVVSEHDATYLRKTFSCSNIKVITNGADIPDFSKQQGKPFNYTMGILSYWGTGSHMDVNWFIEDYLPRLKKIYPGIKLITAGRGADSGTLEFFKQHGIEHLGEIDNLWDFFNRIDIYITTLRKECGILNKVLDAMAHKKIVVGLEHNMYAFNNLNNGFFTYTNFNELVKVIERIENNPAEVNDKVQNANAYLLEHHNWTSNYQQLKAIIDNP